MGESDRLSRSDGSEGTELSSLRRVVLGLDTGELGGSVGSLVGDRKGVGLERRQRGVGVAESVL